MITPRSSPSPADSWLIRCLGVAPPDPKAIMCSARMLAPAEVPPTTAPRWYAARIAAPNGVPVMKELSLSWLPPVMNTASTSASGPTRSGSAASARLCGRSAITSRRPSAVNTAR